MAWRPNEYLLEGELDNTTPGIVSGWMRFIGLPELVSFDLKGDFHRDIRGAKLRLKSGRDDADAGDDARDYMAGLASLQTGDAGDITAGLPPHDYGKHPYIEWYGPNGRVVIEPEAHHVEVIGTPIPWRQTAPVDRERQDELFSGFVAGMAASFSRPRGNVHIPIVARFSPGDLKFTEGVERTFEFEEVLEGLRRHLVGDWGDIDLVSRRDNDAALKNGGVLLSCYEVRHGVQLIIVTVQQQSSTLVMLREELDRFMSTG